MVAPLALTHAPPAQLGAVEQLNRLKADFEKRPPAPSIRRGPAIDMTDLVATRIIELVKGGEIDCDRPCSEVLLELAEQLK
jgi:hypothetical protein